MGISEVKLIKQHLIDPEVCIRCNTCEETCPVDAITHDDRNYVVNAEVCNACGACLGPCPTGSIDHWRIVDRSKVFSLQELLVFKVSAERTITKIILIYKNINCL